MSDPILVSDTLPDGTHIDYYRKRTPADIDPPTTAERALQSIRESLAEESDSLKGRIPAPVAHHLRRSGHDDASIVAMPASDLARHAAAARHRVQVDPFPGFNRAEHPFVGRIVWHGLPIGVENEAGSHREGVDRDGTPWRCMVPSHYGELQGMPGPGNEGLTGVYSPDGDRWDLLVDPNGHHDAPDPMAHTVRQMNEAGEFDEPKTVLGSPSAGFARALYLAHFNDGKAEQRFGGMISHPIEEFKGIVSDPERRAALLEQLRTGEGMESPGPMPVVDLTEQSREDGRIALVHPGVGPRYDIRTGLERMFDAHLSGGGQRFVRYNELQKGFDLGEARDEHGRWTASLREEIADWHTLETASPEEMDARAEKYDVEVPDGEDPPDDAYGDAETGYYRYNNGHPDDYASAQADDTINAIARAWKIPRPEAEQHALQAVQDYGDRVRSAAEELAWQGKTAAKRTQVMRSLAREHAAKDADDTSSTELATRARHILRHSGLDLPTAETRKLRDVYEKEHRLAQREKDSTKGVPGIGVSDIGSSIPQDLEGTVHRLDGRALDFRPGVREELEKLAEKGRDVSGEARDTHGRWTEVASHAERHGDLKYTHYSSRDGSLEPTSRGPALRVGVTHVNEAVERGHIEPYIGDGYEIGGSVRFRHATPDSSPRQERAERVTLTALADFHAREVQKHEERWGASETYRPAIHRSQVLNSGLASAKTLDKLEKRGLIEGNTTRSTHSELRKLANTFGKWSGTKSYESHETIYRMTPKGLEEAAKLIGEKDAEKGFSPSEKRDEHGRWSREDYIGSEHFPAREPEGAWQAGQFTPAPRLHQLYGGKGYAQDFNEPWFAENGYSQEAADWIRHNVPHGLDHRWPFMQNSHDALISQEVASAHTERRAVPSEIERRHPSEQMKRRATLEALAQRRTQRTADASAPDQPGEAAALPATLPDAALTVRPNMSPDAPLRMEDLSMAHPAVRKLGRSLRSVGWELDSVGPEGARISRYDGKGDEVQLMLRRVQGGVSVMRDFVKEETINTGPGGRGRWPTLDVKRPWHTTFLRDTSGSRTFKDPAEAFRAVAQYAVDNPSPRLLAQGKVRPEIESDAIKGVDYSRGAMLFCGIPLRNVASPGDNLPDGRSYQSYYGEIPMDDGDQLEFYLPVDADPTSTTVYLIHQVHPVTRAPAGRAAILGVTNRSRAQAIYRQDVDTQERFGTIQAMVLADFKGMIGTQDAEQESDAEKGFDPDEKRDAHGRWEKEEVTQQALASSGVARRGAVAFHPITGPSGHSLRGYAWEHDLEEYVDHRGEDRVRKVSAWDRAEAAGVTGRDIVHKFQVQAPDGRPLTVSLETAAKLLGFGAGSEGGKGIKSIASAAKTLAKLHMEKAAIEAENERLAPMNARHAEDRRRLERQFAGEQPVVEQRLAKQDDRPYEVWHMGGAQVWYTPEKDDEYGTRRSWIERGKAERLESLRTSAVEKAMRGLGHEKGLSPNVRSLGDLPERIKRQETKIKNLAAEASAAGSDMEKGRRLDPDSITGWRTNPETHTIFPVTESQAKEHPVSNPALHRQIVTSVARHATGAHGGDHTRTDREAVKVLGTQEVRRIAEERGQSARVAGLGEENERDRKVRILKSPAYVRRSLEGATDRHVTQALAGEDMRKQRKLIKDPSDVPRQAFISYSHGRLADESGEIPDDKRALLGTAGERHREAVKKRIAAGEEVSPEVMEDYPELRPKKASPAVEKASDAGVEHKLSDNAKRALRRAAAHDAPSAFNKAVESGQWTPEAAKYALGEEGAAIAYALDELEEGIGGNPGDREATARELGELKKKIEPLLDKKNVIDKSSARSKVESEPERSASMPNFTPEQQAQLDAKDVEHKAARAERASQSRAESAPHTAHFTDDAILGHVQKVYVDYRAAREHGKRPEPVLTASAVIDGLKSVPSAHRPVVLAHVDAALERLHRAGKLGRSQALRDGREVHAYEPAETPNAVKSPGHVALEHYAANQGVSVEDAARYLKGHKKKLEVMRAIGTPQWRYSEQTGKHEPVGGATVPELEAAVEALTRGKTTLQDSTRKDRQAAAPTGSVRF